MAITITQTQVTLTSEHRSPYGDRWHASFLWPEGSRIVSIAGRIPAFTHEPCCAVDVEEAAQWFEHLWEQGWR